ncbi:hypothetical protein Ancab_013244, partial [Ancistrocladus abbreviatus]
MNQTNCESGEICRGESKTKEVREITDGEEKVCSSGGGSGATGSGVLREEEDGRRIAETVGYNLIPQDSLPLLTSTSTQSFGACTSTLGTFEFLIPSSLIIPPPF